MCCVYFSIADCVNRPRKQIHPPKWHTMLMGIQCVLYTSRLHKHRHDNWTPHTHHVLCQCAFSCTSALWRETVQTVTVWQYYWYHGNRYMYIQQKCVQVHVQICANLSASYTSKELHVATFITHVNIIWKCRNFIFKQKPSGSTFTGMLGYFIMNVHLQPYKQWESSSTVSLHAISCIIKELRIFVLESQWSTRHERGRDHLNKLSRKGFPYQKANATHRMTS